MERKITLWHLFNHWPTAVYQVDYFDKRWKSRFVYLVDRVQRRSYRVTIDQRSLMLNYDNVVRFDERLA